VANSRYSSFAQGPARELSFISATNYQHWVMFEVHSSWSPRVGVCLSGLLRQKYVCCVQVNDTV
jgi:hypothetical protein